MSGPRLKLAVNPLPWVFGEAGWNMNEEVLIGALTDLREVGFSAIHTEIPKGMSVSAYRQKLTDHGFEPAPGYFDADFADEDRRTAVLRRARRVAEQHAELGLSEIFIAASGAPERLRHPAVGFGADSERLNRVVDGLIATAEAMKAEGVTAAVHPHVGTWIEVEDEVRTVLDRSAGSALAFGPDTGHLLWAGADPVALIRDYASRVACLHLKDLDTTAAATAAREGDDYMAATFGRHVWTEPGRGAIDVAAVIEALPQDFSGWATLEVDVPNLPDKVESSGAGLAALRAHPAFEIAD